MRWLSKLLSPRRSPRKPSPHARLYLEHLEERTLLNAAPLTFVPTLHATSLTPTATGFSAQFNRAFDPSVLNLYSGVEPGGLVLGHADVTLVGASTGNVKGSIILGANSTSFTFVATGGVLAADTYTITMRSAINGFLGTGGATDPLDGNSDGTVGDNYTSAFGVAAASARVVSIPDFARGPGQSVVVPNDTGFGIPITISDGTGVTSLTFELRYDLTLLKITGYTPNPNLTGTSTISGPVTLGYLQANVPATAQYGSKHLLELVNISVNGGAIEAVGDAAVHVVAFLGDTTGNGQVTSADAQRALRVAIGLDTGFSTFQLADPRIVGDINGDGRLNSADATRILQKAVGMTVPAIPDVLNLGSLTTGGPDPYLNIPKTFSGKAGETITVPVLSYGAACEVLEPKALRQEVKVELEKMQARYEQKKP